MERRGRQDAGPSRRAHLAPAAARVAAALLASALLAGCTAPDVMSAAGSPGPSAAPSVQGTTQATDGPSPAAPSSAEDLERDLRRLLTLPALPSFTVPTDLLSDASRRVTDDLDVPPGLYDGIAVVDARCTDGASSAADAGAAVTGAANVEDGAVSVSLAGDGTGVYDAPGIHVAVLAGGSGVYDDGETRLSVAADGSGSYRSGDVRYALQPDGSGSYDDGTTRVWMDAAGTGGYDDGVLRISWDATGEVFGGGDEEQVAAVREGLAEGLPRFPPVPRIERVAPTGEVCGTVIRLDANVLFDFGSAEVRPDAVAHLERVAALLVALGTPPALVEGHTDQVGDEASNLDLSQRRADAVLATLVSLGVGADSLDATGVGESEPLRTETLPDGSDDPAARQLNRRVELVLLDNDVDPAATVGAATATVATMEG